MSITDELRECIRMATRSYEDVRNPCNDREILHIPEEELLAIADRIDAEHERLMAEQFNSLTIDMQPMTDESMAEHGWVRLPKDADGVHINIHDWVEVKDGKRARVEAIAPNAVYWWEEDGCHWCQSFMVSHYHKPTVEDVLRDFAQEMNENLGMYTGEAIDADEWRDADAKTVEKYAAKLQLREVGE